MLSGTARNRERPATFRDVLAIGEFRCIYAASALSWVGDYLARAAVTVLVLKQTQSVAWSAAAFAISYAPWLLGGSLLISLAERYPYRNVMVTCDVARMVLMTAVALLPLPLPAVLALLLASALFSPPFEAARSATLPAVLPGDRYVVGLGLNTASSQPAQVAGYFAGASVAAVDPRLALLLNAVTFLASALLVRLGVRQRPAGLDRARRSHLLRETADGFRLVFTTPALRCLVLIVFCGAVFAVVPEGLGAAWAARLPDRSDHGWAQGLIMGSLPFGAILGALTATRLVRPSRRPLLLRPLGLAVPLVLVPVILDPHVVVVAVLGTLCGFAMGALQPISNGEFVQALPSAYRARAFGVVQGGLQLLQGAAVLLTGLLAQRFPLPGVVGVWSLAGVVLMLLIAAWWPAPGVFATAATAAAATAVVADPGYVPRHSTDRHLYDTASSHPATTAAAFQQPAANRPGTMEP